MSVSAVEYLEQRGWTPTAAQAIAAHAGSGPPESMIPPSRLGLFSDWCSMMERRKDYATSGLAFLDYEFRDSYQGLGRELAAAKTVTEAYAAAAPYWGRTDAAR